ncbi:hypothetical protein MNBD_GAMMA07-419 [hydrothermal vent metagenome]|uniref:Uncharacterized protein n=1 Tax=hydrothermal vent metagenome TaxID=652676 RepID=A0A3B0XHQ2_9ZZZZ
MVLGLLLITKGFQDDIIGLVNAAIEKDHSINIFMMDDGVYYCQNENIVTLIQSNKVNMSLCDRSCQLRDITTDMIPDGITEGSQLQNAMMHNSADRIINI